MIDFDVNILMWKADLFQEPACINAGSVGIHAPPPYVILLLKQRYLSWYILPGDLLKIMECQEPISDIPRLSWIWA